MDAKYSVLGTFPLFPIRNVNLGRTFLEGCYYDFIGLSLVYF